MQLDHCLYSLKGIWLQIFCKIFYALAKEKWFVVGLAFVINKTCAALNYVSVRVAISVWILFRDREKMTEILKATRKMMQISRVFIIILLLNEITYDFFSLCRVNAFLFSVGCQSSLFILVDWIIVSSFISSWHYFRMIWFVSFKTALQKNRNVHDWYLLVSFCSWLLLYIYVCMYVCDTFLCVSLTCAWFPYERFIWGHL